jgi:hypothetical protein
MHFNLCHPRPVSHRRRVARPNLEPLESRLTPSTYSPMSSEPSGPGIVTRQALTGGVTTTTYNVTFSEKFETTAVAGQSETFDALANFQHVTDPTGFTAKISWGDGTSSPEDGSPVTITPDPRVPQFLFDINGTHTYPAGISTTYLADVQLTSPDGTQTWGGPGGPLTYVTVNAPQPPPTPELPPPTNPTPTNPTPTTPTPTNPTPTQGYTPGKHQGHKPHPHGPAASGLQISGSPADIIAFKAMIKQASGQSPFFARLVRTIQADKAHPVPVILIHGHSPYVRSLTTIDSPFDNFNNNQVYLDDIKQLPKAVAPGNIAVTQGQVIAHFLEERHFALTQPAPPGVDPFDPAHQAGIGAENMFRQDTHQPAISRPASGHPASGTITLFFDGGGEEQFLRDAAGRVIPRVLL